MRETLSCGCRSPGVQRARFVERPQFFSDDQTPRERRKQSTGVEQPNATNRCSSTPLHWKPHFSRMFRDDGLATRAPAIRCSASNSSKVKSITARAASVAETLAPIFDAEPVAEFRRVRLAPVDPDHADRRKIAFDQEHGLAIVSSNRTHEVDGIVLGIGMRQPTRILGNAAIVGETRNCFYVRERRLAQQQPFGLEDAGTCLAQCGVGISCSMLGS